MSIEHFRNQHTPTCDTCGRELRAEFSFQAALTAMRAAGWKAEKADDGTWDHKCQVCQKNPEAQDEDEEDGTGAGG